MKSLIIFKLIPRQFIPLACEHVLLEAWREVTVMPLNHPNACTHLHSKRMYVHPIVEQGKGRISVT
jgi:hypothetical protein